MIDPVGTKLSDDGDPFGEPPGLSESAGITAVFVMITGLGCWMMFREDSE